MQSTPSELNPEPLPASEPASASEVGSTTAAIPEAVSEAITEAITEDNVVQRAPRVFGMPDWIQERWYWRTLFIIVGAWSCAFACMFVFSLVDALRSGGSVNIPMQVAIGFGTSLFALLAVFLPALAILVGSDVRRSVPFVWIGTVAISLSTLLAHEFAYVFVLFGGLALMVWARIRYPRPRLTEEPWGDLD